MRIAGRFICAVMTAAALAAQLPAALAADHNEFVVDNGVLTAYNGAGGDVTIPDGLGITAIGRDAFSCNGELTDPEFAGIIINYIRPKITSVIIPGGVTAIEDNAFRASVNLTSVTLPASLVKIGDGAFSDCVSLKAVRLPGGVEAVGRGAFARDVNLKWINLPSGLTAISDDTFANCRSLTSVSIPYGVAAIGRFAFFACYGLESVSIPGSVLSVGYDAFDGCVRLKSVDIPGSVKDIDNNAFYGDYGLTIRAVEGSFLEQYAKNVGLEFEALPAVAEAAPATVMVVIDGTAVVFRAYNVGGHHYYRLQDLGAALKDTDKRFGVDFDSSGRRIVLTSGADDAAVGCGFGDAADGPAVARYTDAEIILDGAPVGMTGYSIGGGIYYKLREIAFILDFGITWDENNRTILIDTDTGYTE